VFDLYLIEHYILSYEQQKIWYYYLSLIHEYMSIWLHIMGSIFYINNNINNIFLRKNINNILIIIEVILNFILMQFKILL
jgi:hypothetical protein